MSRPPRCPLCGRRKSVERVGELFKCPCSDAFFDSAPNEGGDHFDDPTKRIERLERRRQRRPRHV